MRPAAIINASFAAGALVERDAWTQAIERIARHMENNGWDEPALMLRLQASIASVERSKAARKEGE